MSAGWRFEVIQKTLEAEDNLLNTAMLCKIAGVSRSGYYRWVKAEKVREEREKQEQEDFVLIMKAYKQGGLQQRGPWISCICCTGKNRW